MATAAARARESLRDRELTGARFDVHDRISFFLMMIPDRTSRAGAPRDRRGLLDIDARPICPPG